jgi:hypothetical protein
VKQRKNKNTTTKDVITEIESERDKERKEPWFLKGVLGAV